MNSPSDSTSLQICRICERAPMGECLFSTLQTAIVELLTSNLESRLLFGDVSFGSKFVRHLVCGPTSLLHYVEIDKQFPQAFWTSWPPTCLEGGFLDVFSTCKVGAWYLQYTLQYLQLLISSSTLTNYLGRYGRHTHLLWASRSWFWNRWGWSLDSPLPEKEKSKIRDIANSDQVCDKTR